MRLCPYNGLTYDNHDWLCVHDHIPQTTKNLDLDYNYRTYDNKLTFFTAYASYKENNQNFCLDRICLSAWLLDFMKRYRQIDRSFLDLSQKDINFCAFINKPRPDRLLTSFWLSKKFNSEHNFFYTQGFEGLVYSKQLINLIKDTDYKSWWKNGNSNLLTQKFLRPFKPDMRENYQDCLMHTEKRALLSIITEPCFFEKASLFSEKTLQACLSCCVPFFVNMYEAPEYFEKLGFYAFKDLIDYSDMYEPDPAVRTLKLLDANIDLLTHGFDINKFKYEIEHNFRHAQDVFGVLKNVYKMNNQKLFQDWFQVIKNEVHSLFLLDEEFKKLEKIL